jgi:MYND finger
MGKKSQRRATTPAPLAADVLMTELKYCFCDDNPGTPFCYIIGTSFAKADLLKHKAEVNAQLNSTTCIIKEAYLEARITAIDKNIPVIKDSLTKDVLDMYHCAFCGWGRGCASTAEKPLSCCGHCRQVSYCNRDCQKKHWAAGHKQSCPRRPMPFGSLILTGTNMDNLALAIGGYHKMQKISWKDTAKAEMDEVERSLLEGSGFPKTQKILNWIYGRTEFPAWPGPRRELTKDFADLPLELMLRFAEY